MAKLSPRQRECLLLSATLRDQQVADRLGISVHSVRSHINEAKTRLGVTDRKAALRALATLEGGENQPVAHLVADGPDRPVTADPEGADGRQPEAIAVSWRRPSMTGVPTGWLIVGAAFLLVVALALLSSLLSFFDTLGR